MRRDAQRAVGNVEEGADADMDMFGVEAEDTETEQLSPVSEERELEELVRGYYDGGAGNGDAVGNRNGNVMDDDGFEDDTEYEEAFLEVLSQEQRRLGDLHESGRQEFGATEGYVLDGHGGGVRDGDMDMT